MIVAVWSIVDNNINHFLKITFISNRLTKSKLIFNNLFVYSPHISSLPPSIQSFMINCWNIYNMTSVSNMSRLTDLVCHLHDPHTNNPRSYLFRGASRMRRPLMMQNVGRKSCAIGNTLAYLIFRLNVTENLYDNLLAIRWGGAGVNLSAKWPIRCTDHNQNEMLPIKSVLHTGCHRNANWHLIGLNRQSANSN